MKNQLLTLKSSATIALLFVMAIGLNSCEGNDESKIAGTSWTVTSWIDDDRGTSFWEGAGKLVIGNFASSKNGKVKSPKIGKDLSNFQG